MKLSKKQTKLLLYANKHIHKKLDTNVAWCRAYFVYHNMPDKVLDDEVNDYISNPGIITEYFVDDNNNEIDITTCAAKQFLQDKEFIEWLNLQGVVVDVSKYF